MNDKATLSDFEACGQETIEITIRDKTATYILNEASADTFNQLFAPINSEDKVKKDRATRELPAKIIAACVWRADGSSITFEQASSFRHALQKKLQKAVLDFNGLTDDADEAAKKE